MANLIFPALIFFSYAMIPPTWGVRAWVATILWGTWTYVSTAVTPWQNEGPFDGLGTAILLWLTVLASLGVGARVFWALASGQNLHLAPPPTSMLYRADCMLAALAGLAAGSIATLLLAVGMRGFAGGVALHLAVFAASAALAISALRLPGRLRPLAVTALTTVAGLILAGSTLYPTLIQSKAEIIQPGAPRCIRTPDGSAPEANQFLLLTLPLAQPRRPNLVLTVMTESGPEDFRWSYRSHAFRSYDSYQGGPCPS
jgi:hypothetical protein